jgi:hypothetical protein
MSIKSNTTIYADSIDLELRSKPGSGFNITIALDKEEIDTLIHQLEVALRELKGEE